MPCRVCDSADLTLTVDLGMQPWGNHFLTQAEVGTEPFYPLRMVYCHQCQTAQLDHTVKKEIMFANHTYLSGITQSLHAHFQRMATEVDMTFFSHREHKSVLDIGSNDGTQLLYYQRLGYDVLGVESSAQTANIANAAGIPTLHAFFHLDTAHRIGRIFDVINASGVFFHLEELHSVTEGIRASLKEDGIFVVQCIYMKSMMERGAFDQIYHEHLLYYTLQTLDALLRRHRLALFDAYVSPVHGGSLIAYATHVDVRNPSRRLRQLVAAEARTGCNTLEAYDAFARDIVQIKEKNIAYLHAARTAGKRIFGMGAPVKGNTLLNYFGVTPQIMECLVEKNPLRRGLYSPGSHLPIVIETDVVHPPDIYYVLAWNFRKEILENHRSLIAQGVEFYFPVYG